MTEHTDIVIVGGGMVGATFACAAAQQGFTVTLLDIARPDFSYLDTETDIRVSAITRASQKILESVGAWEKIDPSRLSAYRDMHVWDAMGDGVIHFDSADLGEPDLGHIVENGIILQALYKVIEQQVAIQVVEPIKVASIGFRTDAAEVTCDDGRVFTASLLVGADGARSAIREMAGITTRGWSYGQTGVVATVTTEKHHQETAWQRFMPTGPLAFLPLADGRSSIVWSTSPENAEELIDMDDESFSNALAESFEGKLGKITAISKRAAFPLRMQHANDYIKARLALVGDAAHTIHPLAGQGVNLGFADAASLAEVLADAHSNSNDIGDYAVLRRYERWRKGQNLSMMASMDGFKRLFSNNNAMLGKIRSMGLILTNKITPLKNTIMRQAMGIEGDLPKIAKGR